MKLKTSNIFEEQSRSVGEFFQELKDGNDGEVLWNSDRMER